jgi:EAL domain-containing protein (putative c-di-GMP-specific phosphodiesterase class I)
VTEEASLSLDPGNPEHTFNTRSRQLLAFLWHLRNQGYDLAIDDWGSGYSTMKRLFELPVSKLKIDRYFISEIDTDPRKEKVVQALIQLSHCVDLEVVAEGVETAEQYKILERLGCNYIQGFYTAKPMTAEEIEDKFLSIGSLTAQTE